MIHCLTKNTKQQNQHFLIKSIYKTSRRLVFLLYPVLSNLIRGWTASFLIKHSVCIVPSYNYVHGGHLRWRPHYISKLVWHKNMPGITRVFAKLIASGVFVNSFDRSRLH